MPRKTAAVLPLLELPQRMRLPVALCAVALACGCGEADPDASAVDGMLGAGGLNGAPVGGQGGDAEGFDPDADPCVGHPGEILCDRSTAFSCGSDGSTVDETDCGEGVCVPQVGCQLCIEGQHSCFGNQLRRCNVGPPLQWDRVQSCDSLAGEICHATRGACEPATDVGSREPTGWYYQYALFDRSSQSVFRGGYDVDCDGDRIYVNNMQTRQLDIYQVKLVDSDGDGELEPNQHPDNPDAPGPIEQRVLTHVATHDVVLGPQSMGEISARSDRIFFLDASEMPGDIYQYDLDAAFRRSALDSTANVFMSLLGFDEASQRWYGARESERRVYSFHQPTNSWVLEFQYPQLSDLDDDHMDGLEVVTDPNTGVSYVYVSDMTSDFLGQYQRDRDSSWVKVNLFQYAGTGGRVEGMGFGALNHFWATSGDTLYEIGGGDLTQYVETYEPPR